MFLELKDNFYTIINNHLRKKKFLKKTILETKAYLRQKNKTTIVLQKTYNNEIIKRIR